MYNNRDTRPIWRVAFYFPLRFIGLVTAVIRVRSIPYTLAPSRRNDFTISRSIRARRGLNVSRRQWKRAGETGEREEERMNEKRFIKNRCRHPGAGPHFRFGSWSTSNFYDASNSRRNGRSSRLRCRFALIVHKTGRFPMQILRSPLAQDNDRGVIFGTFIFGRFNQLEFVYITSFLTFLMLIINY